LNKLIITYLESKDDNDGELSKALETIRDNAKKLLSQIISIFPEYTPHTIEHKEEVIQLYEKIIPSCLLKKLNKYEIFFLLSSTYLLDKLTQPLKSRFLKLDLPEYLWEEFLTISNNLIKTRYKHLNENISNIIANIVWHDLKTKDLRHVLQIAKLTYSIEDVEDIANSLIKYKPSQY